MDVITLNKANYLNKIIQEYEQALNCFDYKYGENNDQSFDRTPKLILDVDDLDGGREQIPLPMNLSNELVMFLKNEIIKCKEKAEEEFNSL